ncbi:hypothetical protein [Proteus terrae]|nr:hypothetical protein [Proteus terrae]
MKTDQEIYNNIGTLLYNIAPNEAKKINMRANLSVEGNTCEYEYDYLDNENSLK